LSQQQQRQTVETEAVGTDGLEALVNEEQQEELLEQAQDEGRAGEVGAFEAMAADTADLACEREHAATTQNNIDPNEGQSCQEATQVEAAIETRDENVAAQMTNDSDMAAAADGVERPEDTAMMVTTLNDVDEEEAQAHSMLAGFDDCSVLSNAEAAACLQMGIAGRRSTTGSQSALLSAGAECGQTLTAAMLPRSRKGLQDFAENLIRQKKRQTMEAIRIERGATGNQQVRAAATDSESCTTSSGSSSQASKLEAYRAEKANRALSARRKMQELAQQTAAVEREKKKAAEEERQREAAAELERKKTAAATQRTSSNARGSKADQDIVNAGSRNIVQDATRRSAGPRSGPADK
jgi:hypothetical protein